MPQQQDRLNPLALSRLDLAAALSRTGQVTLTPNAINHWMEKGCPRNSDRTYSLLHVAGWLAAKYASTPNRVEASTDEEKREAIGLKRERRLAIRQARLIEKKLLLRKEDIEQEQAQRIHAVRGGLLALERVLAREIVGLPAARAEQVIGERVRALLEAYAAGWNGQGETPFEKGRAEDGSQESPEGNSSSGTGVADIQAGAEVQADLQPGGTGSLPPDEGQQEGRAGAPEEPSVK